MSEARRRRARPAPGNANAHQCVQLAAKRGRVVGGQGRLRIFLDRPPRDEGLHAEDDVFAGGPGQQGAVLRLDAEQPGHERRQRPRHGDEQLRLLRRRQRLPRPIRLEPVREPRIRRSQLRPKPRVQLGELQGLIKVPIPKLIDPQRKAPPGILFCRALASSERKPVKHSCAPSYHRTPPVCVLCKRGPVGGRSPRYARTLQNAW